MIHQFSVDTVYTAAEIAGMVGGSASSAFPMVAGHTVALRLRPDIHRDAPELVHVDAGPVAVHGIEAFVAAGEDIPMFMRDPRRNLYAYVGMFHPVRLDKDHDRVAAESERIGHKVTALLYLRAAD